ncbi:MAG: hypothetical protein IT303_03285 [Dehalococcoidia bacterium]|nr:hypothetical protein [Dehalococcoidia bacterium]
MEQRARGVGKCAADHLGSFGYPTRPAECYGFCSQCGGSMVWDCPSCHATLPDDPDELKLAHFCRECGSPYFEAAERAAEPCEEPALRIISGRAGPAEAADRAG